eukprot:1150059-Pelagomonas_calceolata.AAC.4
MKKGYQWQYVSGPGELQLLLQLIQLIGSPFPASQETALPQHTWEFQIIAVWNTAAIIHLNNQNHTWLQDLAKTIPEAKWVISNVSNYPIQNTRHHDRVMLGIRKCEKLPLDIKQNSKGPKRSASDISVKPPCQSHPNLQLKIADWRSWAYTDGSCHAQNGETVIGPGVYHPMSDSQNLVEPNGP